uniref:Uncharacterized protein n=1 Tax=Tanacetum cinerariifolium TaxID=118510 RepID=A0A699J0T4_TANCI|nr:hypothetical protein [Tanacetum cinerariifolium]
MFCLLEVFNQALSVLSDVPESFYYPRGEKTSSQRSNGYGLFSGLCQSSRSDVALEHSSRWYTNSVIILQVPLSRSDNQKNLYNALVESYNSAKDIITSYGDVVLLKRGRDDQDKDEDPPLDQTEGKKEGNMVKILSPLKIQEEPSHTVKDSGMQ